MLKEMRPRRSRSPGRGPESSARESQSAPSTGALAARRGCVQVRLDLGEQGVRDAFLRLATPRERRGATSPREHREVVSRVPAGFELRNLGKVEQRLEPAGIARIYDERGDHLEGFAGRQDDAIPSAQESETELDALRGPRCRPGDVILLDCAR